MAWNIHHADSVPDVTARSMADVGVLPIMERMKPGRQFKINDQTFVVIAEASEDQFVAAYERVMGRKPDRPFPADVFYYRVSTD